jgi:hypothetical protein
MAENCAVRQYWQSPFLSFQVSSLTSSSNPARWAMS